MDSDTQQQIQANTTSDPNFTPNADVNDIPAQKANMGILEDNVKAAEQAPTTTFADESATGVTRATLQTGDVGDAINAQAASAEAITTKQMTDLGTKIGVDFGDLSAGDIGSGLAETLGESAGALSTATAGLGLVGNVLDFLGPIGMLAGLGASIAGLATSGMEKDDLGTKTNRY